MVTEGSTVMRCAVEFGKIISQHFNIFPPRIYTYTDRGLETKVDNLSVQKSYISIFLNHDIAKILVACTAANLSFRNPVEHCHAITNQGLQTTGAMRKYMASEVENYINNVNSNKEIRKICSNNKYLLEGLKESLNEPKHLIEDIPQKLSLKGKSLAIYEPATTPQIKQYEDVLVKNFDENILTLIS